MKWSIPPGNSRLGQDSVHVWSADLDDRHAARHLESYLSPSELNRAASFKFQKDRTQFVVARGVLRSLSGSYTNHPPGSVSFEIGEHGKPFIPGNPISFNISHSEGLGLFAFSKRLTLGVDIECTSREAEFAEIASRFFSPNEFESLMKLPDGQRKIGFYNCWTRKEAFIKAVGEGLSYPLDAFEVSLVPGEPARLISVDSDSKRAADWSLTALSPKDGFIGALAATGAFVNLECYAVNDVSQLVF